MKRALLACAALAACVATAHASGAAVGQPAPPLAAPKPDGSTLKLEDLRGRVVYVDFWASWCGPCRQAMPEYQKLWQALEPSGLTIVGVNVDTERELAVRALKQSAVTFPVVLDPKGTWPNRFDIQGMPTAYLIDRKGVVRYVHGGFTRRTASELEEEVEKLLAEKP